jgi:hypothetical protein
MCSLNIWILMPLLNEVSGMDGKHPFQTDRMTLCFATAFCHHFDCNGQWDEERTVPLTVKSRQN